MMTLYDILASFSETILFIPIILIAYLVVSIAAAAVIATAEVTATILPPTIEKIGNGVNHFARFAQSLAQVLENAIATLYDQVLEVTGVKQRRINNAAAVDIQRATRGLLAGLFVQLLRENRAAAMIQRLWRGALQRMRLQFENGTAIQIQALIHGVLARVQIQLEHDAAAQIQALFRGVMARLFVQLVRENRAATKLQALIRGVLARVQIQFEHDKATQIQSLFRGVVARLFVQLVRENRAATKLQALIRGVLARFRIQLEHDAATQIQALIRGILVRIELGRHHDAATLIQKMWRGKQARSRYAIMLARATMLRILMSLVTSILVLGTMLVVCAQDSALITIATFVLGACYCGTQLCLWDKLAMLVPYTSFAHDASPPTAAKCLLKKSVVLVFWSLVATLAFTHQPGQHAPAFELKDSRYPVRRTGDNPASRYFRVVIPSAGRLHALPNNNINQIETIPRNSPLQDKKNKKTAHSNDSEPIRRNNTQTTRCNKKNKTQIIDNNETTRCNHYLPNNKNNKSCTINNKTETLSCISYRHAILPGRSPFHRVGGTASYGLKACDESGQLNVSVYQEVEKKTYGLAGGTNNPRGSHFRSGS